MKYRIHHIYKSKAIEVKEYIDLGTWEQIYKWIRK